MYFVGRLNHSANQLDTVTQIGSGGIFFSMPTTLPTSSLCPIQQKGLVVNIASGTHNIELLELFFSSSSNSFARSGVETNESNREVDLGVGALWQSL